MAVNFLNDVSLGSDIELKLAGSSGGKMFANSKFYIQGDAINFRNYAGSETYAVFQNNGAVNLYYNNSVKLETTSSGVEVTGDVNLSGGNIIVGSQYGIRFNVISPGGIFEGQNPKFVEKYEKKVPLGRMAEEEDITGIVKFLISDDSKYITGQNIIVDGGWTI